LCIIVFLKLTVFQSYSQAAQIKVSSGKLVYLHTDRIQYNAGESIFFKAYILSDATDNVSSVSDTLHVSLIDQYGTETATGIFPVKNYEANGSIRLSQYLTEGNYILIAFTSGIKNSFPGKMFSSILEVKNPKIRPVAIVLSLKDSLYAPGSLLKAEMRFSGKDDRPLSSSFSWQLTDNKGEIKSGKGKSGTDGIAKLEIQLPAFRDNDTITLLVSTSNKGKNIGSGIVIPTGQNRVESEVSKGRLELLNRSKQLNIKISTDKPEYKRNEDVIAGLYVTDDQGTPVVARLSLSASDPQPDYFPFQDEDILDFTIQKNNPSEYGSHQYFAKRLSQITRSPDHSFILQEKNDPEKIRKEKVPVKIVKQYGYPPEMEILDIIRQIKPYQVFNGKIMFANSGIGSINFPEGALVVVDGIKMGTDAAVLNTIPVPDIAKINVLTNAMDIQRYAGMNSTGVIEIIMKKGNETFESNEPVNKDNSSTLCWQPDIVTNSSGEASVSFKNSRSSANVVITVHGISVNEETGISSIQYSVK